MFIRRATIFDFFSFVQIVLFFRVPILLLRAVQSFLRNNNNDYVFRRRLFNDTKRFIHNSQRFASFQCKKKKKLNRRKNERIRNTMKELFYLEAKRGKRDQRGAVKSNFDKFKSNLNDRLQFCSKTKGRGEGWKKKKGDSICHAKITACESEKYYAVYWQIVIDFLSNQQERLQKRRVAPTTFTEIFVLTYSS